MRSPEGPLRGVEKPPVRFRVPARRVIKIASSGPRDRIYEETLRLVSAERRR